jgi:hypothetical protein
MTILEVAELAGVERKQIRGSDLEEEEGCRLVTTCNLFMRVGMLALSGHKLPKPPLDSIKYPLPCLDQPPESYPLPSSVSVE